MIVDGVQGIVLSGSSYEKKDKKGKGLGEYGLMAQVLIDFDVNDIANLRKGEVRTLFSGDDFEGDPEIMNTLERYDPVFLKIDVQIGSDYVKLYDLRAK